MRTRPRRQRLPQSWQFVGIRLRPATWAALRALAKTRNVTLRTLADEIMSTGIAKLIAEGRHNT